MYKILIEEFERIVGKPNVVTNIEQMQNYLADETPPSVRPKPANDLALIRPGDTQQVSSMVRLASKSRLAVFPRGGGTGLVGGAVPTRGGIILSMERMNRIEIDEASLVAVADAGVTLGRLANAAEEVGLSFPPHPGDENAQVGGLVATNAGGSRAVRHGVMRNQVMGIEVVLPTGEILNLGGRIHKNNVGYDLM
jgi:glycolate oxidase